MSIGLFPLADTSISDVKKESAKKLMPKRIYTASPDRTVVPEPR
jgi:hypothetical protein